MPSYVEYIMIKRLKDYEEKLRKDGLTSKTVDVYMSCLRPFAKFCLENGKIRDERGLLKAYERYILQLKEKGDTANTLNNVGNRIKNFFEYLQLGVVFNMKIPERVNAKRGAVGDRELHKFIQALKRKYNPHRNNPHNLSALRNLTIATMLSTSGMRVGELVNIKVDDLNLQKMNVFVNHEKNGISEIVPFDEEVRDLLEELLMKWSITSGYVFRKFGNDGSEHLTERYIHLFFKNTCKEEGIKKEITPHNCRYTVATELFKKGMPLTAIQGQLGHTHVESTRGYVDTPLEQSGEDIQDAFNAANAARKKRLNDTYNKGRLDYWYNQGDA